jgi:hypothetical protein
MHRNKINKEEKTDEQKKARVEGLLQKEKERRDRLKELEIEYDFPGFSALVSLPKKNGAPAAAAVKQAAPASVKPVVKETPKVVKEASKPTKEAQKPVVAAAK